MLMLVSCDPPHTIFDVNHSNLLGYGPHNLMGRSLAILTGPQTNAQILRQSLLNVGGCGQPIQFPTALYDVSGKCRNVRLTCEPARNCHIPGRNCILTISASDTILQSCISEESDHAWALVSSEWPHFVESVNLEFTRQFELSEEDIVGQNLHRIKPYHTASTEWRIALGSASEGRRTRQRILARTATAKELVFDLECVPVSSAPGGSVDRILALLIPAGNDPTSFPSDNTFTRVPSNTFFSQSSPSNVIQAARCSNSAILAASGSSSTPLLQSPYAVDSVHRHSPSGAAWTGPGAAGTTPVPASAAPRPPRSCGRPPSADVPAVLDDKYVRRVRRRHLTAERRAAAAAAAAADADADADSAAAAAGSGGAGCGSAAPWPEGVWPSTATGSKSDDVRPLALAHPTDSPAAPFPAKTVNSDDGASACGLRPWEPEWDIPAQPALYAHASQGAGGWPDWGNSDGGLT
jgi:hypothetical protein